MSDKFAIFHQFVDLDNIEAFARPLVEAGLADDAETAALSIQQDRIQYVVDKAARALGSRMIDVRQKRDGLAEQFRQADDELQVIEDALGMSKDHAGERDYIPVPERNIVGQVDFETYRKILLGKGWGEKLIANNWMELIEISSKKRSYRTSQLFEVPEPQNYEKEEFKEYPDEQKATIDTSAFIIISRLFHSYGPGYTDEIRAIKALMPNVQSTAMYHYFRMWDDFAQHCVEATQPVGSDEV